jgi:fructose/tagatose bisphosphate aldolase
VDKPTLKELLHDADHGGYAIPSFNYSDLWDFLAIAEAAQEEQAPVMVASNPLVVQAIGADVLGAVGRAVMGKARIPLIHHLDHSFSVEMCKEAIDQGYPSVMIDASKHPLEENIRQVKEVVAYAHPRGYTLRRRSARSRARGSRATSRAGISWSK